MKLNSVPWWVALLVGAVGATAGFGAGFAGGFLSFAKPTFANNTSSTTGGEQSAAKSPNSKEPLPKFPALKGEWVHRSKADFFRKFGEGDRTDVTFDGHLGRVHYNRAMAVSEKNGSACGILVSFSEHHVSEIEEIHLGK